LDKTTENKKRIYSSIKKKSSKQIKFSEFNPFKKKKVDNIISTPPKSSPKIAPKTSPKLTPLITPKTSFKEIKKEFEFEKIIDETCDFDKNFEKLKTIIENKTSECNSKIISDSPPIKEVVLENFFVPKIDSHHYDFVEYKPALYIDYKKLNEKINKISNKSIKPVSLIKKINIIIILNYKF